MEFDRNQILASVLKTIEGISDKEYQKRVWIRGEGPEVDDFDETCCNFFGDGDPILENYQKFKMTENQYQTLKKFRDKFRAFSNENTWPPEFVDSPEWQTITEMAKEVLQAFNYSSKREKENVLIRYFCNIKRLLDREQEKQVWIVKEGPEDEIFEFDIEDSILEDYKSLGITDSQYQLLIEFRDRFRKFSKECGFSQDSMDTEEWKTIIELGRELLNTKPLGGLL